MITFTIKVEIDAKTVNKLLAIMILTAKIAILTSVGFDAYVNHVLIHTIDVKTLSMIKTAIHYHQVYAVIISAIGLVCRLRNDSIFLKLSGWIFIIGVILFSFSIYLKALTGMMAWIKLTPIGGTFLMVGWFLLACSSFKYINSEHDRKLRI